MMNLLDDLRLRDVEQVVTSFELLSVPIPEPVAAERRFIQVALLDHGASRSVHDDDALAQQALQLVAFGRARIHFVAGRFEQVKRICSQPGIWRRKYGKVRGIAI